MNRRDWLTRTSCLALGGALSGMTRVRADAPTLPEPTPAKLPRWRGFNLLSMFNVGNKGPFPEEDFALIAELGDAGLSPLPVFTASLKDPVAAPLVRHLLAAAPPAVVLNATGFAVASPGERRPTPLDEPGRERRLAAARGTGDQNVTPVGREANAPSAAPAAEQK